MRKEDQAVTGQISLTFSYAAGQTGSRFFAELRDHRRIIGTSCSECHRVLVPARQFCSHCVAAAGGWVEVSPRGTLVSYTVIPQVQPHQKHLLSHLPTGPLIYGLIRLEGADTNLVHLLGEIPPETVRIGMRVQAVFREKREGNILDITYFKPVIEQRAL